MAEKILSERVVSRKVIGSANPIAKKFRSFKGSFGGICIAPILIIIAFGILFYSEKFKKNSEVVEQLTLETATEVTADSGMHKIKGTPVVDTPIKAPEVGDVLYYSYKEQKYEEVEKTEEETITTIENGQEVEETIERVKLVDEWVDKESKSEWAGFKLGNYTISPNGADLELKLQKKEYMIEGVAQKDYKSICESAGGTWLAQYNECEGIGKTICGSNDGEYKMCESPCRHNPVMENCTDVCVEVCTIVNPGEYVDISGKNITPDIGDYRLVVEYLPLETEMLVIGEISGTTVSGGDTFIVSNKSDTELLSDLKGEETAMYWIMKGVVWLMLTFGFLMILGPILSLLDFIPVAGKAASCVASIIAAIVSAGIVIAGTLIIKYWFLCIALAVIGVVGLVVLLVVLMTRKKGDKVEEEKK
ncbi:MAG: TMEM43 family protein [Patescibacteria group bacterium]|nr:TMEM43 family protein [Patescibacteria group bacterium]